MATKKRKWVSMFDGEEDDDEPVSAPKTRAKPGTKKVFVPPNASIQSAVPVDGPPPAPPKEFFDNRKLRFSKTIDRQDGTAFDFLKPQEAQKYLPLNIAEDLDYTSCEDLEREQFKRSCHRYQPMNDNHSFVSQIASPSHSSNYSSSSENNKPLLSEQSDSEELFRGKAKSNDEDDGLSSSSSNDILNMPTSKNLNELEELRHPHPSNDDRDTRSSRRPPKFCFGCMWQDPYKINVDLTAVSHMMQTMYRLFGQIKTKELAKIIHKQFMHTVYYPFMQEQEEQRLADEMDDRIPRDFVQLPIWRTREIFEHLHEPHIKDPRFYIHNKLEELREHSRVLSGMSYIYVRDAATGNEYIKPDLSVIKTCMDLDKRQTELYNMKYKQMNFYNERLPVNIDLGGSAINLHKNLVIKDKPF